MAKITDDDIVLWLLRAMCNRVKLPTNDVLAVEREARLHWGGARPYVPKGGAFERADQLPGRTLRRWEHPPGRTPGRPRKLQRG